MEYLEGYIPFFGFYESPHSIELENFEYYFDNGEITKEAADIWEQLSVVIDWHKVEIEYIKLVYIPAFEEQLKDDIPEIAINENDIAFKQLYHPKEYNFETDKILCSMTINILGKIWNLVQTEPYYNKVFSDYIRNTFKSRSGFIPFYSDVPDKWLGKSIIDFDPIEILSLLDSLVIDEHRDLLYIDLASESYEACLYSGCTTDQAKLLYDSFFEALNKSQS